SVMAASTLPRAQVLCGFQYALLDEAFAAGVCRTIRDTVGRLLITLGATDQADLSRSLIEVACRTLDGIQIDLVVGPSVPVNALEKLQSEFESVSVIRNPSA